jgi:glycosyltransferase involved in cell wall biosynthesis
MGISNQSANRTRLLLIIPSAHRGGAEEYTLRIASAAATEHWDVHAAVPMTNGNASLIREFQAKGILLHPLHIPEKHFLRLKEESARANITFSRANGTLPVPARLRKRGLLLRLLHSAENNLWRAREAQEVVHQFTRTLWLLLRTRPDVVLLNLSWPTFGLGIILACGALRIPSAVVFHLHPFPFFFRRAKLKAYRWARMRSQRWITVSESNRKLMCVSFQIRDKDVLCIHNGSGVRSSLALRDSKAIASMRSQVREELGLARSARLLLTVARLEPQKGYDYLIPTIPHLVREFPDIQFVWVGEGEQKDFLVQKLREYGVLQRISLLGFRSDVARLMRSADLFVLATRYEGHPFALLEAMMHGLPIVAVAVGGIPEVIEHKVHGLLSRTGDSCDLLEAVRWALRHPSQMQSMARNAKKRVQDFSEGRMVNETLGVLRKLSGSGSIDRF